MEHRTQNSTLEGKVQAAVARELASTLRSSTIGRAYFFLRATFIRGYEIVAPEFGMKARDREELQKLVCESAPVQVSTLLGVILERQAGFLHPTVVDSASRFWRMCAGLPPAPLPAMPERLDRRGKPSITQEFLNQMETHREACEAELIVAAPALANARAGMFEIWLRVAAMWQPPRDLSALASARKQRLEAYVKAWAEHGERRSETDISKLAMVDRSDLYRWKKGAIADASVMSEKIDRELRSLPV